MRNIGHASQPSTGRGRRDAGRDLARHASPADDRADAVTRPLTSFFAADQAFGDHVVLGDPQHLVEGRHAP